MRIREKIRIEGMPFPAPLPLPVADLLAVMMTHGHQFEAGGNSRSIQLIDDFEQLRFENVKNIVNENGWCVAVKRNVWPEYFDSDYTAAPLWEIAFPDIRITGGDHPSRCAECGFSYRDRLADEAPESVPSDKPLLSVNGRCEIISTRVTGVLAADLIGLVLEPFDGRGDYFRLSARSSLGQLIADERETIGLSGTCSTCGRPVFETLCGPMHFDRLRWNGDDVVREEFFQGVVVTPKAFELFHDIDNEVTRLGVVVLD